MLTTKDIHKALDNARWNHIGQDDNGNDCWLPRWVPERHRGTAWLLVDGDQNRLCCRKPSHRDLPITFACYDYRGPSTLADAIALANESLVEEVMVKDALRAIRQDLLWAGTDLDVYVNSIEQGPLAGEALVLEVGVTVKGDPSEAKGCGFTMTVRCAGPTLHTPAFEDTSRDTWHLSLVAMRLYEDNEWVPLGAMGQVVAMAASAGRARVVAASQVTGPQG